MRNDAHQIEGTRGDVVSSLAIKCTRKYKEGDRSSKKNLKSNSKLANVRKNDLKEKLTRKIYESPVSGNKAHLKSHYKHHLGLERNLKDIIIYWQTIILHPSSSNC